MSMVNGRQLSDVLAELRVKRQPDPKNNKAGKPFFSIKEYMQLFDSAVGVCNYNIDYSDYTFSQTSSGQELYSVKCRISILDDDGRVVLYRECYGGYVMQQEHNTGKDVNLQNSAEFVCNTAFKNAAKKFGVFGKYEDGEGSKDYDNRSSNQGTSTDSKPANKEVNAINVRSCGTFTKVSEDNGRPVYTLCAKVVSGDKMEEDTSNIVFYPNQYKNCAELLNKCISACSDGKQHDIRLKVSTAKPRNGVKQYIFKGFNTAA